MKKAILSFLFCGAILSASSVSVTFVDPGTQPQISNGVYVGPYTLNVNGVNMAAMCMDDFLEVSNGDHWQAHETSVTSSDLHNTYLGNHGKEILGIDVPSSQIYRAEAYLFSLLVQPNADRADIQVAAWSLMDTATLAHVYDSNDTGVENYLTAVADNYESFDASGYSIISQIGFHRKQEFMVANAPEPTSIMLFGGGLFILGAARFMRKRKQVVESI